MYILDYPDLLDPRPMTEERKNILTEAQELMIEFVKEHPITIIKENGEPLL